MVGLELAVEQRETADPHPRDEPGERHLRRVPRPRYHALAKKGAAEREAVQPADQLVADPAFDRMGMAHAVQGAERVLYLAADPGFRPIHRALGTEPDHVAERGIGGHPESIRHDRLAQRA